MNAKLLAIWVGLVGITALFLVDIDAVSEPLPLDFTADYIEVVKSSRTLSMYAQGQLRKTYFVSLGGNPIGQKFQEGDRKTPEGRYTISGRNPQSAYHLSLRISYPEPALIGDTQANGLDPGGDIMIHKTSA